MNFAELYWVDLPDRQGHEQRGTRPTIIWQDTELFRLPTVLVIPLTGRLSALDYAGTLLIEPSSANGLSKRSVALVFQLGACDVRRVRERIGQLDEADVTKLRELAMKLQKL